MFVKGREIPNPHSAIRLFSLCSHMKWAHLPVAGGIYDQHPDFIDKMAYIFSMVDKVREEEQKKSQRDSNKGSSGGRSMRGRASRGRH